MLSVTAFFGAKARASECVKACLHTHNECSRGSPKAEVATVCQASPELLSLGRVKVNFFSVLCTLYSCLRIFGINGMEVFM